MTITLVFMEGGNPLLLSFPVSFTCQVWLGMARLLNKSGKALKIALI